MAAVLCSLPENNGARGMSPLPLTSQISLEALCLLPPSPLRPAPAPAAPRPCRPPSLQALV